MTSKDERESIWENRARIFTLSGVAGLFVSFALLKIPSLSSFVFEGKLLLTGSAAVGTLGVITSFIHYLVFIRNRLSEGMTKGEARREYMRRFPSYD
jgi:hypothetical protein